MDIISKTARPTSTSYIPQPAPEGLTDHANLEAWQKLFKDRETWAIQTARSVETMLQQINSLLVETDVIKRAASIAGANPKQHMKSIHEKYLDAEKWVDAIVLDQEKVAARVDQVVIASKGITTYNALTKVISGASTTDGSGKGTLDGIFNKTTIDTAQAQSRAVMTNLDRRLEEARNFHSDIILESEDLISQLEPRLEALSEDMSRAINILSNEMQTCVKQIKADCENTRHASNNSRSLAAISKTALLHAKKFLPTLYDTAVDTGEVLKKVTDRRNSIEELALHFLQRTAAIESSLSVLQSKIRGIDISEEEDAILEDLARIAQNPSIYASILVEVVRRLEWNQKMLQDTSTLAEEMALHKADEEKRRRKWQKSVEGFLGPESLTLRVRSIEISVTGQEQSWPALSRADIEAFVQELGNAEAFENVRQEISALVKTLDIPPKSQAKKINSFTNGALNESRFGRNSLLLRGDEDLVASLKNDKRNLEHQLKGSESRIRKLEDLVHRANQMTRPLTSSGAPPNGAIQGPGMERNRSSPGYTASPRLNDSPSRRSSIASHRLSINQTQVEDNLFQQIVQLESDLANERKKTASLEESAVKKTASEEELRKQIQDAANMKKDLMDNFQTQQQDFETERKLLEDQVNTFKIRMEEIEEEYDRVLGSHDNARGAYSELVKEHEEHVENMKADASLQLQRAHDRIGDLQSINNNQRGRLESIEDENQRNIAVIETLKRNLEQEKSVQKEQSSILSSVLKSLDPDSSTPTDFTGIVGQLELVIQKANDQNQDLRLLTNAMKGQNEAIEARSKDREIEFTQLQQDLAKKEKDHVMLKESSSSYEARLKAMEEELDRERESLRSVRGQLPGSEVFKAQLAEAEKRAEALSLELVSIQASGREKEIEALKHLKLIESLQTSSNTATTRLHDRAHRASEISQLLYLQTDRLTRLLEHIGFSVSREDDAMIVQRVTRNVSGTASAAETTQHMSRSLSGPVPQISDSSPPDYLRWAAAIDPGTEKDFYEDFLHESKAFDLDSFCEAVVKRIKDTEHIARKWQREARTYRDRHRNSQFEAHHKIAFRAYKEGDLALFLPTRSQAPQRSWAAFNIGAPHYFLREQDKHRLMSRDWLLARITNIEERLVDLSKSMNSRLASGISEDGQPLEDENPFGLSDGLKWYYLDAEEERTGAPIAPGPGKTTVASMQIEAEGSIQRKKNLDPGVAARVLTKSLDSRRSSGNSRKSLIGVVSSPQLATTSFDTGTLDGTHTFDANGPPRLSSEVTRADTEGVCKDQLLDP